MVNLASHSIFAVQTLILKKGQLVCFSTAFPFFYFFNKLSLKGLGHTDNVNKPVLMKKDDSLLIVMCGKCFSQETWDPSVHGLFSSSFRRTVFTFLLCVEEIQRRQKMKVPKSLILHVIKSTI